MSDEPQTHVDRSRSGSLIHSATNSGRWVHIVTYIEGGVSEIKCSMVCRTAEQAAEVARLLREAKAP